MKLKYQRGYNSHNYCYRVQNSPIYQDDAEIYQTSSGFKFLYATPEIRDWFLDIESKIKIQMMEFHPDLKWISPLSVQGVRQVLQVVTMREQNRNFSIILTPLFVTYNHKSHECRLKNSSIARQISGSTCR